jgi:hypothetical protein
MRGSAAALCSLGLFLAVPRSVPADGMMVKPVVPPGQYAGSVEERAQEAILIFHGSEAPGGAVEDMILKVRVAGDVRSFGWVIPFPAEPVMAKEDPALFKELHDYVEARLYARRRIASKGAARPAAAPMADESRAPVQVIVRKVVGSYDIAVVREHVAGGLAAWLEREKFQKVEDPDDVIGFYRRKGYVFACLKVSEAALEKDRPVDLHPVRFTFKTGGRDGIYFPMKMTGLQRAAFDVNLHVFYKAWVNDKLSKYGYVHRGFRLRYRDWDTSACVPNGGKAWSAPGTDPFLKDLAARIPVVTRLFQKLHPGERYYLTSIQARGLRPDDVRHWSDDLWLFPYYVDTSFVPFDARPGGPAAGGWRGATR